MREIRLLIAEKLMLLILRIMPKGEEKITFASFLVQYSEWQKKKLEKSLKF
jgi:hypothetical protein